MEKKCGCWSVLRRSVSSASCRPSDSRRNSSNSFPRTSLVYDAVSYYQKAHSRGITFASGTRRSSILRHNSSLIEGKSVYVCLSNKTKYDVAFLLEFGATPQCILVVY